MDELLTRRQVADLLKVTSRQLDILRAQGLAPTSFCVGKRHRWTIASIQAWIAKGGSRQVSRGNQS